MSQIFNHAVGVGTGNGSAIQITVGYEAMSVRIINATKFTEYYWNSELGTDTFVRSNFGALSLDPTSLIALSSSSGSDFDSITISATAVGNLEDYTYEIIR